MTKPQIKLENLNVIYTNPEGEKFNALKNINLEIFGGEYVAILGTSGSGKTTLSNIIGMLNSSYTGQYFFEGNAAHKMKDRDLVKLRGDLFGFIFQDYVLLDHLTALENVALALHYENMSKKKIFELAEAKLNSVGLGQKLHHKPAQLSGGQKQRVSIARALIKDPKVIIADEPTGALDHVSRVEVISLLQELNTQGVSIITVTHSDEDAQAAKRIIRVEKGEVSSDRLQRNRTRYFGQLINKNDKKQLNLRKNLILEHVILNYGILTDADFLSIPEELFSSETIFKLMNQFKTEWMNNPEVYARLKFWFENYDELIQLLISMECLKAKAKGFDLGEFENDIKAFFSLNWDEETSMHFLVNLKSYPTAELKKFVNFEFFFKHYSNKVRATAINFFKINGFLDSSFFDQYADIILKDSDHRVRSNMLDYLYSLKDYDFKKLINYHFEDDSSGRVRAIWAEILFSINMRDEALSILNKMIFSENKGDLLGAVWVLAKDKEFQIYPFLKEKIEENPSFISYVDDILKSYARVKKDLMNFRLDHSEDHSAHQEKNLKAA